MRRGIGLLIIAGSVCFAEGPRPEDLIEAGHWKRARVLVEERLRKAQDDPEAIYLSSQVQNAFGDHTGPLGLAEKAVRLNGKQARYHRQLAEVYGVMAQHAGLFQQMMLARRFRREIDTALALDPRDTQALRDLLEFYLLAPGILGGDAKKAEATAQRISGIDASEGFLAKARIAGYRKDAAQTESLLRQAAEVRPLSYKAQIAAGQFYLEREHRDDGAAEKIAKVALGLDSGRAEAYCLLAAVYAARAQWSELDAILSSAARAVPDDPAPYYSAADRLLSDGREPGRAAQYLRVYLQQEPEGNRPTATNAHGKLGLALRALGQKN